jgi:tetratricopeptide (TPR) repeat protein
MGKPEEAKTHFKRAMLYGGKDSVVILDHYAEVLFALGEYDRAMVYWNKALKNNKGEVKDLEERINMRKQQKKAK